MDYLLIVGGVFLVGAFRLVLSDLFHDAKQTRSRELVVTFDVNNKTTHNKTNNKPIEQSVAQTGLRSANDIIYTYMIIKLPT